MKQGGQGRPLSPAGFEQRPEVSKPGEAYSRQRKQLVQRREGKKKLGISGGRDLAKSGQCG